ncbi:Sensor protein DivL [Nocardioides dokdonensis FR1436]|uniref:histidine kinase n=1 Tax=Nocardioides dokdonensis FR1436 TaxID=1300347 RepID=A0A1A9GKW0_9ACTN|nr:PAS domain-containing sensor histidine kinase [Nocardioides dokdonensis]ANH38223.1 Sensor protein DivL [Nocardioides dokdonensis FR1436]
MRSMHGDLVAGSNALLRATLNAVPDAVVVVDERGVITAANIQVEAVFGYRPDELEGQRIEVLVPPRLRTGHPRRRNGYSHRPMGLLQLPAYRRDGVEFPAEISLAPIATDEGHLTVATVRDISERLRLEAEADRLRDELLATISHELRTPLTSIIGYTELLEDLERDAMSPLGRDMLAKVRRNAGRELRLVDDLLTLAVDNLGHMHLRLGDVDLLVLVGEVVEDRRHEARRLGLVITVHGDADTLRAVRGDRHRLTQALDNLVANAVKFTATGGRVDVHVSGLADSTVVTVTDTGAGISSAEQKRVFERLYRGRDASHQAVPGTGLGLALTKGIVEAHQGSVTLRSELGVGTTVTVQLPHRPPRD